MSKPEDVTAVETSKLLTLSKEKSGDLVEIDAFENLPEQAQKDVLFLRESRLRGRRFHRFWPKYEVEEKNWIRGQKIYGQMAAYGRVRELTGQCRKLLAEVYHLIAITARKLAFWR